MNITNITLWSEAAAFPILSALTLIPLATLVLVMLIPSPAVTLRLGFITGFLLLTGGILLPPQLKDYEATLSPIQAHTAVALSDH